jgi:hypothetical protein
MLKQCLFLSALLFLNLAQANNREVLDESHDDDSEEVEELLFEQSILESLFIFNPGIIVTPYYDQFGRAGAKITPSEGDPYYVDPHYDDPMQTNRHSDEANTDSNWRVFTWGE